VAAKAGVDHYPGGIGQSLIDKAIRNTGEVGADRDFWVDLADDKEAARRALVAVMRPKTAAPLDEAREIMGPNFHGVDQAGNYFSVIFTPKQRKLLEVVPFSVQGLQASAETHLLVAGYPLTIMDMLLRDQRMFYSHSQPWFGEDAQHFATRTKVKAAWHLVRKTPLPGSTDKAWNAQRALVPQADYIPSTALVAYAATLHAQILGERIYAGENVRTSDVSVGGFRVDVGDFTQTCGLVINYWNDEPRLRVGLAVATRPIKPRYLKISR
jgi:hypothetical protein